jgi:hypothetical protein
MSGRPRPLIPALLVLFTVSLAMPFLLLSFGVQRMLDAKYLQVRSGFRKYLLGQNEAWLFTASDNIIRSGFLHFSLAQDLAGLQSHLNALAKQFDSVKAIALYDRNGRLFMATDYKAASASLSPALLVGAVAPVYEIVYAPEYNRYVLSITGPLKNTFSFQTGFVRILFLLDPFLESAGLTSDHRLFLASGGRLVPLNRMDETPNDQELLKPSSGSTFTPVSHAGHRYLRYDRNEPEFGLKLVLLYRAYPRSFFWLAGINGVLVLALLAGGLYYLVRRREVIRGAAIRRTTDEVLQFSQKTMREVGALRDIVGEMRAEKAELRKVVESAPVGRSQDDEDRQFQIIEPS